MDRNGEFGYSARMATFQASGITPAEFIAKWTKATLSERAASQEHFIDLCRLLGQPTPAEHDSTGSEYAFEKGVSVTGTASKGSKGDHGFADVWWRGKFAWEYKRKDKHRDLTEAYRQICQYREALGNPPLMIVSDITRTEIHTNFTGTAKQVHVIELAEMDKPKSLDLLRRVFTDPGSFKPTTTTQVVTEEIARQFGTLAKALHDRGNKPHDTAHFLMKCMFCLFAEDVELLPEHLFERLLKSRRGDPAKLMSAMTGLFAEMKTGGSYLQALISVFGPHGKSDLCCYWFANATRQVATMGVTRCGLLSTQSIRHGGSRRVLDDVVKDGHIFAAYSHRPWILDGAAVRVAIICFSFGREICATLDGLGVVAVNSDLTAGVDLTRAESLASNKRLSFEGIQKGGPFDFGDVANARLLLATPNPGPQRNSSVVKRRWNASLLVNTRRPAFIVDFGPTMAKNDAANYEAPFEYVVDNVKLVRAKNKNRSLRCNWWIHKCPRPDLLQATTGLQRILVTPRVSEHRIWAWLPCTAHVDSRLFVFAYEDDYLFGVLHSSIHEVWSLGMGAVHGKGNDPTYNNTTCFETFALPWSPGEEPEGDPLHQRIAVAAKELNEQRERWLNPPEWIDPIAAAIDAEDDFTDVPDDARALIRESAIMARAAKDKNLKTRTLTNLYNERPTWLCLAHERLDKAVLAAYASIDAEGNWSEDWAEVWIDTGAGQALPDGHKLCERRGEVDQLVLGNLLRMNLARART